MLLLSGLLQFLLFGLILDLNWEFGAFFRLVQVRKSWRGEGSVLDNVEVLTVLIAFKNERQNLPGLLEDLKSLGSGIKVIWIDDHSSDGGGEWLKNLGEDVMFSRGEGKKAAIATGLDEVVTRKVWLLDADVRVGGKVLESLNRGAERSDVVIGWAPVNEGPAWLRLENAVVAKWSLQAVLWGVGYTGWGRNMVVEKRLLKEVLQETKWDAGWDDRLVVKARNPKFASDLGEASWVSTSGGEGWFEQKKRHRKGGAVHIPKVLIFFLFFLSSTKFMGGAFLIFNLPWWNITAQYWFVPIIIWMIAKGSNAFHLFRQYKVHWTMVFFEPFIICFWGLLSVLGSKNMRKWKS